MRAEHLVEVRGLAVRFATPDGEIRAVDGADFDIPAGKTVCLVGESGSGKSVAARSLMRLEPAHARLQGQIHFRASDGQVLDLATLAPGGRPMRALRGKDIGMVFQEPMSSLSPVHTIGTQMLESVHLHLGLRGRAARERCIEMLGRVGVPRPAERMDSHAFELSGGLRQRAMIAMALVCQPRLLIADEPTTALDVSIQAGVLALIRTLQSELGMAVLFITHDLGVVAQLADDVAVMYQGRIVERAPVDALFDDPCHPYTAALLRSMPGAARAAQGTGTGRPPIPAIRGMVPNPLARPAGCTFHPRCDFAQPGRCDQGVPAFVALAPGRAVRCVLYAEGAAEPAPRGEPGPPPGDEPSPVVTAATASSATVAAPATPPLLQVRGLAKRFVLGGGLLRQPRGVVQAVNDVSFSIHAGETLSLVGESGCGKTTVGRLILRVLEPSAGTVEYTDGQGRRTDVARLAERELVDYRRQVRLVFQDPAASLNPRLTVRDAIAESLVLAGQLAPAAIDERVQALIRRVGLRPEVLNRHPHAFSGGERQRISIARALAPGPRLVVADEALSALDVSVQAQTINLLLELQRELGLAYLFISHDLAVVRHLSDRVAVMYLGRIVEIGPVAAVYETPRHPYTSALLRSAPQADPRQRARGPLPLSGEVPDPAAAPAGCAFHPRCPHAQARCHTEVPAPRRIGLQQVACHRAEELALPGADSAPPSRPHPTTGDTA